MSVYAHAVWLPPITRQVFFDTFGVLDTLIKCAEQQRVVLLSRLHLLGERKLKPVQHLPNGRIRIGQTATDKKLALSLCLIALEHALEEAKEFGDARLPEILGFLERLFLLVLVVFCNGNGVVRVVGFVVEVQCRQCVRQNPSLLRFICTREV